MLTIQGLPHSKETLVLIFTTWLYWGKLSVGYSEGWREELRIESSTANGAICLDFVSTSGLGKWLYLSKQNIQWGWQQYHRGPKCSPFTVFPPQSPTHTFSSIPAWTSFPHLMVCPSLRGPRAWLLLVFHGWAMPTSLTSHPVPASHRCAFNFPWDFLFYPWVI